MARLPKVDRLSVEQLASFPEAERLEKLLPSLNGLIDGTDSLNKKLTLGDNHAAQVFTFNVDMPSTDWVSPTLSGAWANFGAPWEAAAYRKSPGGITEIRGLVGTGVTPVIFTLPAAYAPSDNLIFAQYCGALGGASYSVYQLNILANGQVDATPPYNGYVSVHCSFAASDRTPIVPSCFPLYQKWDLPTPPTLCWVGKVTDREDNSQLALGPTSLNWECAVKDGANHIKVNNVVGLQYGRKYAITLVGLVG